MPTEITMPSMGANIESGMLSRWLVREGQRVAPGEVIAEIESDKATMELEADREGVIARILVAEGPEQVKVGEAIAVLANEGEKLPDRVEPALEAASGRARNDDSREKGDTAVRQESSPAAAQVSVGGVDLRRIKASPIARRLARERRIDLSRLSGSGPNGRIIKIDVERVSSPAASGDLPRSEHAPAVRSPGGEAPYEVVSLSSMRRTIARRLTEAKTTIPHFYLTVDICVDALLRLRSELNEAAPTKISINDMLIKALGCALIQTPDANVQFAGEALRRFRRADVAVAVAIPGGLVTPVIQGADAKSLVTIAAEMQALAQRARDGRLAPHEYQGGTASLSNLGMYGVRQFDAVINPPQALIVAVGAGEKRAIVHGDGLQVATVMTATGSFDHRAIDGATGAQLMAALKHMVEQPVRLVL